MRLDGRRESTNVDDRRGRSSMKKAGGLGLGGLILVGIISLIMGGNPLDVIQQVGTMDQSSAYTTEENVNYTPSAEEEELALFAKRILAGTEDVWTAIFAKYGKAGAGSKAATKFPTIRL